VRHEHHGPALARPEPEQVVIQPKARDLVERGEGLVHQQDLRLRDERARDRHPHAHAARELARIGASEAGEADLLHGAFHPWGCISLLYPTNPQRQVDVVEHRRPRHERRVLEYKADLVLHAGPLEQAAAQFAQARDQAQHRALAAAGGPEQADELAFPDREIEALEGHDPVGIDLVDAAQREQRRVGAHQFLGLRFMPWALFTNCSV